MIEVNEQGFAKLKIRFFDKNSYDKYLKFHANKDKQGGSFDSIEDLMSEEILYNEIPYIDTWQYISIDILMTIELITPIVANIDGEFRETNSVKITLENKKELIVQHTIEELMEFFDASTIEVIDFEPDTVDFTPEVKDEDDDIDFLPDTEEDDGDLFS